MSFLTASSKDGHERDLGPGQGRKTEKGNGEEWEEEKGKKKEH